MAAAGTKQRSQCAGPSLGQSKHHVYEFGAIFERPFTLCAVPFDKTAGFNWAFVEGYGAYGRKALKNRTKLNLCP